MFTGITQGVFEVTRVDVCPYGLQYQVCLNERLIAGLREGASVAVDGVCQTVVRCDEHLVTFDAIYETLEKTTLKDLKQGQYVSIERSLCYGDEIGGHEVSGHVIGRGRIVTCHTDAANYALTIQCPLSWMQAILPKGFIAVDGSSLTVGPVDMTQGLFTVYLIPETLKRTRLGQKKINDDVNIELDYRTQVTVETVVRLLEALKL